MEDILNQLDDAVVATRVKRKYARKKVETDLNKLVKATNEVDRNKRETKLYKKMSKRLVDEATKLIPKIQRDISVSSSSDGEAISKKKPRKLTKKDRQASASSTSSRASSISSGEIPIPKGMSRSSSLSDGASLVCDNCFF